MTPTALSAALVSLACGQALSRVAPHVDAGRATLETFRRSVAEKGDRFGAAVATARAIRVPVPPAVLSEAVGTEAEAARILDLMAWGEHRLFVPAALQRSLRGVALRPEGAEASGGEAGAARVHDVLAAHHLALDGAPRATDVAPSAIVDWFEKVHHLGQGGDSSVAKWEALDLPGPEFYWDRGRWLSMARRDHATAARVYAACRNRFRDDAYSWHYEAFNLERAGADRGQAEVSYHRAVALEPGNVWFHRRLVTFYIGLGRFRAAEGAYNRARGSIADNPRAPAPGWYAENFHHDIARAWLLAGEVEAARKVLDDLSPALVEELPDLRRLDTEIADAEEAEALGESVYAPDVPRHQRWRSPLLLAQRDVDGAALVDWSPGRVREVAPEEVRVVLARRTNRVVLEHAFPAAEWREVGWGTPSEGEFVEIGRYASGRVVVLPVPTRDRGPANLPESAYFDRWSRV